MLVWCESPMGRVMLSIYEIIETTTMRPLTIDEMWISFNDGRQRYPHSFALPIHIIYRQIFDLTIDLAIKNELIEVVELAVKHPTTPTLLFTEKGKVFVKQLLIFGLARVERIE